MVMTVSPRAPVTGWLPLATRTGRVATSLLRLSIWPLCHGTAKLPQVSLHVVNPIVLRPARIAVLHVPACQRLSASQCQYLTASIIIIAIRSLSAIGPLQPASTAHSILHTRTQHRAQSAFFGRNCIFIATAPTSITPHANTQHCTVALCLSFADLFVCLILLGCAWSDAKPAPRCHARVRRIARHPSGCSTGKPVCQSAVARPEPIARPAAI